MVGNDYAESLLREIKPNKQKLQAGSTVAHLAFYTAELLGCDPAKKTFSSTWIDSNSAVSVALEGKYDEAKKTRTMRGKSVGMDGQPAEVLQVWQYADADHMSFEMKGKNPDGTEMSYMTIHYTRRKK